MPNPFVDPFGRKGALATGGIHSVSGGSKKAGPPMPPQLTNIDYWFDTPDPATVWADTGQIIQAVEGNAIRSITNKGLQGDITEGGPPAVPTLRELVVNGLSIARGSSGSNSLNVGGFPGGSGIGESFFAVGRIITGAVTTGANDLANLSVGATRITGGRWNNPGNIGAILPGMGAHIDTGKVVILDEWCWVYGTIDAAGNWRVRASGAPEVTGNTAYATRGGSIINLNQAVDDSEWAEFIVWNIDLTVAELDQSVAYADAKYGVMPF